MFLFADFLYHMEQVAHSLCLTVSPKNIIQLCVFAPQPSLKLVIVSCQFQKGTVASVLLTSAFLAPHVVPGTWYLVTKYLSNGESTEPGGTHTPSMQGTRVGTTLVQGSQLQETKALKDGPGPSNIILIFSPSPPIPLTNDRVINSAI